MSGYAGVLKGRANEGRVLRLIKTSALPWITSVGLAPEEDDQQGIDIQIFTDRKDLFLQVKSSPKHAQRFRSKYKNRGLDKKIAVITVLDGISDEYLLKKIESLLTKMYYDDSDALIFMHEGDDWQ